MNRLLKYDFLLIILFLLFMPSMLMAQSEAEEYKIDSTLYKYYQNCKANISIPEVLLMSDTLFRMAGEKKDLRMQAVALSTKLDYYYYQSNLDSVVIYTRIVKDFARKTNQPKYYYFAWGKRLIQFYTMKGLTVTALYESEKMLAEAKNNNDKIGLSTCYNVLGVIYEARSQTKLAYQYKLEEVNHNNKYQIENYNESLLYRYLAAYCLEQGQSDQALEWLKKAEATSKTIQHKLAVAAGYVAYYSLEKNFDMAYQKLQEAREIVANEKRLGTQLKSLYGAEITYYRGKGEYAKAINVLETMLDPKTKTLDEITNIARLKSLANLYSKVNRKDNALKCYQRYIEIDDSLKIAYEEMASSEFATLLNVEKLNVENNELILKSQQAVLHNRKMWIVLLIVVLIVVVIFLYRVSSLNNKLKRFGAELLQKNEDLMESQAELSIAKEKAEEVSRMKTTFIQNMSHEIRTPLNSIVGFSQVIAGIMDDNKDVKEFADIIEHNTTNLLKLVSDVIDIAQLDSSDELLPVEQIELNNYCRTCIDFIRPKVQPNVVIEYISEEDDNSIILANKNGLSQVLNNILHNAAKFTEQGKISLCCRISEEDQRVIITVTDTGIGIPVEQQDSVFERFVKLDDYSQGAGLGLSICQLITQKMSGQLYIDTTYTDGARFVLEIPTVSL